MDQQIVFKNKTYTYVRSFKTQITDQYVPDWNLFHALRESIQNMVDETVMTGAGHDYGFEDDPESVYFYDRGRGVKFEDILYLGVSGKRGVEGVVGQHGEGEVVSSVVAARMGIKKYMASQNWLAAGHIESEASYNLLVIDYYETSSPRNGTGWYYEGEETKDKFLEAYKSFTPPTKRTPLIAGGDGQLYTNGMAVNTSSQLHFGYNLKATPGRDRGGFTVEQIRDEAKHILEENAGVEEIADLLKSMTSQWWHPEEAKWDLDIDPEIVQRAARKVAGSRKKYGLVWANLNTDGPAVADAMGQGIKVLKFQGPVPYWVERALPSAREAVSGHRTVSEKDPPRLLAESIEALKELMDTDFTAKCVHKFEEPEVMALHQAGTIVFARYIVKELTFIQFVETVAHEVAHMETGAADCTRLHASGIENIMGRTLENAMTEDGRAAYERAKKAFEEYTK